MTEAALLVAMADRQNANGTFVFMLNIGMVIFIFYFLLIRPQRKEQERHQQMITAIKKGDEIVTSGGIIGKVTGIADDVATVEVAQNVRKLTTEMRWYSSIGSALGAARSKGKPVVWIQALGDLDGFL